MSYLQSTFRENRFILNLVTCVTSAALNIFPARITAITSIVSSLISMVASIFSFRSNIPREFQSQSFSQNRLIQAYLYAYSIYSLSSYVFDSEHADDTQQQEQRTAIFHAVSLLIGVITDIIQQRLILQIEAIDAANEAIDAENATINTARAELSLMAEETRRDSLLTDMLNTSRAIETAKEELKVLQSQSTSTRPRARANLNASKSELKLKRTIRSLELQLERERQEYSDLLGIPLIPPPYPTTVDLSESVEAVIPAK